MRKWIWWFAFSSFVFSSPNIKQFSITFMGKLGVKDYNGIFEDFYIPPDYTEKNIRDDREAITEGIKFIIEKQVGEIKRFISINKIEEKFITISYSTGPSEEIKKLKKVPVIFKVEFSKFGSGYIVMKITKEKDKFKITDLIFCLPSSNPKSAPVVQNWLYFMMRIAEKQGKI